MERKKGEEDEKERAEYEAEEGDVMRRMRTRMKG